MPPKCQQETLQVKLNWLLHAQILLYVCPIFVRTSLHAYSTLYALTHLVAIVYFRVERTNLSHSLNTNPNTTELKTDMIFVEE